MFGLHLDLTITLGDLVMAGTFVVSSIALYTNLIDRLARMEVKIDALWNEYERRRIARGGAH